MSGTWSLSPAADTLKLGLRQALESPAADERGSDLGRSDRRLHVDCPRLHGQLSSPMQLRRFGDDSRYALDKDAPPASTVRLIAVSFEGEHCARDGCVELVPSTVRNTTSPSKRAKLTGNTAGIALTLRPTRPTGTPASRRRHSSGDSSLSFGLAIHLRCRQPVTAARAESHFDADHEPVRSGASCGPSQPQAVGGQLPDGRTLEHDRKRRSGMA